MIKKGKIEKVEKNGKNRKKKIEERKKTETKNRRE